PPPSAATSARAASTAARAARPRACRLEALPGRSRSARATASITSGRGAVVALWSRSIIRSRLRGQRHLLLDGDGASREGRELPAARGGADALAHALVDVRRHLNLLDPAARLDGDGEQQLHPR